jgi:hypothetical protein
LTERRRRATSVHSGHGRMSTLRQMDLRDDKGSRRATPRNASGPQDRIARCRGVPARRDPCCRAPAEGFRRPTGSPPVADRSRSLGSGMQQDSRYSAFFLPVFKPIAYESTAACHDETSSSGRMIPSPCPPRPAEPFASGGPSSVRRERRDRAGPLRVGTQRADGLGKAAVGHMQCRRPASPRHDSVSGRRPGPPTADQ